HFGSSKAGPDAVAPEDVGAVICVALETTVGASTCTFKCFTQTQPTATSPLASTIPAIAHRSGDVCGGERIAGVLAVGGISVALKFTGRGGACSIGGGPRTVFSSAWM